MADYVNPAEVGFTGHAVSALMTQMLLQLLKNVWPFFLIGVVIAVVVGIMQVGWKVSFKPMEPKLSKFNPISGFKRIFSKESLFNLVMAVVKITVIGLIAYFSIRNKADDLFILYEISLNQAIALMGNIILNTGLRISLVYLVVGLIDYVYQKHKFSEDMKMTKQEVKDEYKNTEGDPQIKGQQRRKMQEASQRRMMKDVPKADVVITNPTHFAVALRYDADAGKAPVVVAKGEDYLALKIKEAAKENNVEIVENKPLARMLYHNVDIGAEIPPELYQAVAEVLATVYRMKNR
jgi:flagellar biosynthetic protein FlhB